LKGKGTNLINFNYREIHYHTRSERLRAELRQRYDWSSAAAFSAIDSLRENAINHRNLAAFMKLNGYYPTESEVVAIIRRLDIDAD
jgi:Ca2+-binding EF-hand superfamily protein